MKKILVIDDEKDFGLLMQSFFVARNFKVVLAHTIADGLRLLETERPDFILLDNDMPDGAGWCHTEFILVNYPKAKLNLISALGVPKKITTPFRILEKPLVFEELEQMFV